MAGLRVKNRDRASSSRFVLEVGKIMNTSHDLRGSAEFLDVSFWLGEGIYLEPISK